MNKEMTNDTKRALEAIQPIADILGLKVSADDSLLYINDMAIGIGSNSTWATVYEFIGYCFMRSSKEFRSIKLDKGIETDIKRYWYSKYQLEQMKGGKRNE